MRYVEVGSLTLRSDGILHTRFDFETVGKDVTAEYLRARGELVGSDPGPVLLEIVQIPYVDREIRKYLLDSLVPAPCRAVVATDQAYLTILRSLLIVEQADIPTQVFPTVEAAVEWIHSETAAE